MHPVIKNQVWKHAYSKYIYRHILNHVVINSNNSTNHTLTFLNNWISATSNSCLTSSSPNEYNHTSESENLFPPILDIDNLFPTNERNSSSTPVNAMSSSGSESTQDSSSGHILLPPIFIGQRYCSGFYILKWLIDFHCNICSNHSSYKTDDSHFATLLILVSYQIFYYRDTVFVFQVDDKKLHSCFSAWHIKTNIWLFHEHFRLLYFSPN